VRRRLKAIALAFLGTIGAAAAALTGGYLYLRRSLPQIDGTVTVAGITGPVEIVRDTDGIPHIFAATKTDGLFGLGYVHAQDRLWQMEFQRRIGFGELSAILGPSTIAQDRFLRTVGFGRAARAAWSLLAPEVRRQIDAYVAGINAFLDTHHGSRLPPEFTLLRFEPRHWTGPDVIVWQKMMAWDLSGNYSFELLRHDLAARVGAAAAAELLPRYPADGLSIIDNGGAAGRQVAAAPPEARPPSHAPDSKPSRAPDDFASALGGQARAAASSWTAAFRAALSGGAPAARDLLLGGAFAEALGSNNWVVDGAMTASGRPLVANDPHLAARIPSVWYLAHLAAGEYDAIGATMPGAPGVVLGRNRRIAWAATNLGADVEDLYREKLDPTGRFAEFEGRWEKLQIIRETIEVRGRAPVHFEVRVSRHGPLVSDAINAAGAQSPARRGLPPVEPLALRWTALDPHDPTVAAILALGEARDWSAFTRALRDFVVPSQNFLYADVDGHIGYLAPGRIPVRRQGDGAAPVEGWTGAAEWTGWVPFDALPRLFDPPQHAIVTANHRPAPPSYPYFLGLEWAEPYRALRVRELLEQRPALTAEAFAAMQADRVSLHARRLLPVLLEHAAPRRAADAAALALLREWRGEANPDSAAAAVFASWFQHLVPALVGDDLGPQLTQSYAGRYSFTTRFVLGVLGASASDAPATAIRSPTSIGPRFSRNWCDDGRTPRVESCGEIVSGALDEAVSELAARLGPDPSRWRWGRLHQAVFPHQGLDGLGLLRPLVSRREAGGGDWSTINVGPVAAEAPYEQRSISSYREIIDLAPGGDSRFADAVGQSGHPLSPHYDDFLKDWAAVRYRPMRMERGLIEQEAAGRLWLRPAWKP